MQLPVLSIFYGIIVRMYREQGGKHNMPHIHAEYSGEEIVVALDGTVLEGSFHPSRSPKEDPLGYARRHIPSSRYS